MVFIKWCWGDVTRDVARTLNWIARSLQSLPVVSCGPLAVLTVSWGPVCACGSGTGWFWWNAVCICVGWIEASRSNSDRSVPELSRSSYWASPARTHTYKHKHKHTLRLYIHSSVKSFNWSFILSFKWLNNFRTSGNTFDFRSENTSISGVLKHEHNSLLAAALVCSLY